MKIIKQISDMQLVMKIEKQQGKKVGFVPTMGYLHEGHQTLLKEARENNDIVVLSIFVNPLQFGPNEDLDAYPRDFERDEEIAALRGVDYLFYPTVEEMYKENRTTIIKVEQRVDVLCGKHRPGHFDGVATVVMKLFQIVTPDTAYFGMKDAQQVAVIDGLINDYHLPIDLVRVGTVREEDGLAKSSRNVYLNQEERTKAPYLFKALALGKLQLEVGMEVHTVKQEMEEYILLHTGYKAEYVEIYAYPTLQELKKVKEEESIIIAIAVKFSKARLIDNIVFSYSKGE
ncbi:pantoate--beta-alanine ligase [Sutcliffiella horikoshii]|uniref:Pantothenate synthetase n=1 Tax=Sutcliffiella horikoshii TaxID=79883 RepID=A0A5D4TIR1_9BACI|nr:pantoate--beta-alanine ligase [Sutcliffiella horikoshii]TYS74631.1 pantoate--beta-alanine ligase [Sutcliffiella horikoshii]